MTIELGQGTGPLRGVRVVELAGIGPGPHAAHDPGRPGRRRDPHRPARRPATHRRPDRPAQPRPPERRPRPQAPRRRGHRPRPGRDRRRAARGTPPRYDGAARPRPRRVPGPQPAAGLRADDRLGPGRPARADRRPRPRLHRDHRRALRDGSGPEPPAVPEQPGGRLRRRVDVPRDRRPRRPARVPPLRRGAGGRRRDRRRHRPPERDGGRLPGRAGTTASSGRPTCSTAAPPSTTCTRPPTAATSPWGRSSRSSTTTWSGCSASPTPPPTATTRRNHPDLRRLIGDTIRQRTQAEWTAVFEGSDACVAPVLPMTEAFDHPHLVARGTFVERDGMTQPAPAPRFSRTAPTLTTPPPATGRPGHPRRAARLGDRRRRRAARLRRGGRGLTWSRLRSTDGTTHVDVLIIGAGSLGDRCGGAPDPDAAAHVVRRAGGAGGQRRHLGPLPLPRHPLRLGHVHDGLPLQALDRRGVARPRRSDPGVPPRDRPRVRRGVAHPLRPPRGPRVLGQRRGALDRRGRARRRDGDDDRGLPVELPRLLRLRARPRAGVRRRRGVPRPDRASPALAGRPRLVGQERRGDRQRRDRGDAGAGDGARRRARDDAAALPVVRDEPGRPRPGRARPPQAAPGPRGPPA